MRVQNFHSYVQDRIIRQCVPEDRELWVARGLGGVVNDATGECPPPTLSPEEWEVAHLYTVFGFRKVRRG